MKYLSIIIFCFCIVSCNQKKHWGKYVVNDYLQLDTFWKEVTGYDSLQITSNYEGDKLNYNFCYPNKWEFIKFKKDTVFIHDTVVVYYIKK